MITPAPIHTDIVLVGGGHAHVEVLKQFGMKPVPGVRLNLISPDSLTPYSGMLPGYLAGHYDLAAAYIELRPLCRFAQARFYRTRATGISLTDRMVQCADRPPISFDLLSIDTGSTPSTASIAGAEHAIPVKPVDRFLERWDGIEADILASTGPVQVAVVGAGAGGVEAAMALHHRMTSALKAAGQDPARFRMSLVAESTEPIETHPPGARDRVLRALDSRGIAFRGGVTVTGISPSEITGAPDFRLETDYTVLVTPAGAPGWLKDTGLSLDERGFIEIGETLASVTDADVFAAGDVAAFTPAPLPKSGVYAVREGPVLAENLRRRVDGRGRRLKPFKPQKTTLALISLGRKRAVFSRGRLTLESDWTWRLKDWIDRRWMEKYRDLPEMDPLKMAAATADPAAEAMRCGGCGAKVPADVLTGVLAALPAAPPHATVRRGLDAPDDAAVLSPPAGQTLVQTVDQFRTMVSDPWLFGRIAALHSMGDIWAMGAAPSSALAAVTLPVAGEAKMAQDLAQLLLGARQEFDAAGVSLVGGHTAEGAEMALGFTVNGFAEETALLTKAGLRPGDALILTKPLGTGALLAAEMQGEAVGLDVDRAITAMLQPNAEAARIAAADGASAMTDVTGFGLLGHLAEMAAASAVQIRLEPDTVPALPGATALLDRGIESSLQPGNERSARGALGREVAEPERLLCDPQTAGGLLIGIAAGKGPELIAALHSAGLADAAIVAAVEGRQDDGAPLIAIHEAR